jgi:hypothetical protein
MIQNLKENFDAEFKKGKWYFKLPSSYSWFVVIFCAIWGGGFAASGTFVLLFKLGIIDVNISESPEGAGWIIGPLFSAIGYIALLIGLSNFFGNRLEVSTTSIKVSRNFFLFKWRKFGISKTNLKSLEVMASGSNFGYQLQVYDPEGKPHKITNHKEEPALKELADFIREYMELD